MSDGRNKDVARKRVADGFMVRRRVSREKEKDEPEFRMAQGQEIRSMVMSDKKQKNQLL